MRWLVRYVVFWLIVGPLLYVVGLPILLDYLSKKTQKEAYSQCETHLVSEGMIGKPESPITPARGEKYCHCVSDGLILTKNDVFDLVQKKPALRLNDLAQEKADTCNKELMDNIAHPTPVTPTPTQPDGLIHL